MLCVLLEWPHPGDSNEYTQHTIVRIVDVCNRSDCIIKIPHSEMKGMQEKESIMGVRDREKNLSLWITVWHHLASLVMPNNDLCDEIFSLPLIPTIHSYVKTQLIAVAR